MDMKRINSGKLQAIDYDVRERLLRVELEDGTLLEYCGVGTETLRSLCASGSAWSYYRYNIEGEFTARRVSARRIAGFDDSMRTSSPSRA